MPSMLHVFAYKSVYAIKGLKLNGHTAVNFLVNVVSDHCNPWFNSLQAEHIDQDSVTG